MIDIVFTIKILIIVIVAFLVITAWDEVIDRALIKYLKLDREEISTWLILAIIATVLLLIIIILFNVEAHDLLGVSETIDTQLTGQAEIIKNGKVIHIKSP